MSSDNKQLSELELESKSHSSDDDPKPRSTVAVQFEIEMIEPNNNSSTIQQSPTNKSPIPNHTKRVKTKNICFDLVYDVLFWIRIFVLILCIFLLLLSVSYCIAQLIEVKLDIITECTGPKTREEIWHHSFMKSNLENGDIIMNEESQFGHTDDSCWTTKTIEFNTDQLWFSNQYRMEWNQYRMVSAKCILFGIISIYLVIIISYNIITQIQDIIYIAKGKLHKKSSLYAPYIKSLQTINNNKMGNKQNNKTESHLSRNSAIFRNFYFKYFVNDTTGWIIMKFMSEFTEIFIQSQALLLYNGYHVFDANNKYDVYLANKPHFIVIFAAILSFNCFGSGFLWLLYALIPQHCHGLLYKRFIFFVDKFSDLLYTLFPFYVIIIDDYNTNTNNILVLLGQMNMESTLVFAAAFIPLWFLCNKCLIMTISTMVTMRKSYFKKWKAETALCAHSDINTALKRAKSAGYHIHTNSLSNDKNIKEIYDENGDLVVNITVIPKQYAKSWIDKNGEIDLKRKKNIKQILLSLISLCLIIYSIFILTFTVQYINTSKLHCHSVMESAFFRNGTIIHTNISEKQIETLSQHPELFLWDKCLYKVYPFVRNDKYKCECRVFVIDWDGLESRATERETYFNLTQTKILSGILSNWIMLEKFKTFGTVTAFSKLKFVFSTMMFRSVHMRAFEWNLATIDAFGIKYINISSWKELEYLQFKGTHNGLEQLPDDFGALTEMKYLSFISSGLGEIPSSICNLAQLNVLQIEWEPNIESIPHCINNLENLRVLSVDGALSLSNVPLSLFNLPNLVTLSLFRGSISYESILYYNLPIVINVNDTDSVNEWFDNNFVYGFVNTEYWLSLNPICDNIDIILPSKLQTFINSTCHYLCNGDEIIDRFCIPRKLGDGRCDIECADRDCFYDFGDCTQLCFASELTNCSWDKLTNDKCDKGCNNKYCSGYKWGSDFIFPDVIWNNEKRGFFTADLLKCPTNNISSIAAIDVDVTCKESAINSIYIDPNIRGLILNTTRSICVDEWIFDGTCDDTCRTNECTNDGGDCESGCVGGVCNEIYQVWLYLVGSSSIYKVDHTNACNNMWPIAVEAFGIDTLSDSLQNTFGIDDLLGDCSIILTAVDYNNDGYTNFREFVVIAYGFASDDFFAKSLQINCSQCIGMEYYNI